ncbi:helix-turn-helix domain-containing protein [Gudongella sp. DL1XJH-153]|uniref:helix-turn-helix domain-containing protein n=1 Tax=Gudongella sp. DL1XJH-153 TaxID=3409804 RepID=UPI003BB64027
MRKEYVEYMKDLPINIYLASIDQYPLHWQDAIEVIFVLEGSVRIGIESETYVLDKRELEIINPNEVYRMEGIGDNLVLILQIDPVFFEKYYEDARDTFYYTNSSDDNAQEEQEYYQLRTFISVLVYEAVSKLDDYEDQIEDNLLSLMYHLLNNFHYLFYDEESLKEDEIQLERYHRIMKYLSNNYMDKVSLQDIAKKEFLSSQYLSYKIKEVFGHGFNEYLNQIRVEESTKLLIDTDKSISEISEEVGFSHTRYYNKHFKIHYKCTPIQYRKKNKVSEKQLEQMRKIDYLSLKEALPYLEGYLTDYERFNFDNRIFKLDVDLKKDSIEEVLKPVVIDLGDISLLLEEENRKVLREIQGEIGFKYCLVNNLFSDNMDIYRGKNRKFINWTRVENILEFLEDLRFFPIISTKNVEGYIVENFKKTFSHIYDNLDKWLDMNQEDLEPVFPLEEINHNHDTLFMAPYILYSYTSDNRRMVFQMMDEITKDTVLDNETFFGGSGIFTANYLNKPSFYAYKFLSLLGEEVLDKGDGYLICRSEEGYQILLYNPPKVSQEDIYSHSLPTKLKEKKISINLYNMDEDFQITKYDLNRSHGSVYDKWIFLGRPGRLTAEQWTLLDNYVHPNVSFYYGKKAMVFNILATVKPNGCILYTLNYGQKQ